MDYLCGFVLTSVSHIKVLCLVSGLPKKGTFRIPSDEKEKKKKSLLMVSIQNENPSCSVLGHSLYSVEINSPSFG